MSNGNSKINATKQDIEYYQRNLANRINYTPYRQITLEDIMDVLNTGGFGFYTYDFLHFMAEFFLEICRLEETFGEIPNLIRFYISYSNIIEISHTSKNKELEALPYRLTLVDERDRQAIESVTQHPCIEQLAQAYLDAHGEVVRKASKEYTQDHEYDWYYYKNRVKRNYKTMVELTKL